MPDVFDDLILYGFPGSLNHGFASLWLLSEVGIWSASDMNAVKETEVLDQPKVMTAVGTCDIASEKIMPNDDPENLKKYEDFVSWVEKNDMSNIDCYGYVPGAHDWFTWSQLAHIFFTEYLWK